MTRLSEARAAAFARARAWVTAHDASFARMPDEPPDSLPFVKRVAELAVIADVLIRVGDPDGRTLLETCWDRLERGAIIARLAPATPPVATVYVPFWRHGLRNAELETAVVASASAVDERPVQLLITCALRACELTAPWDLDALLRDSWLGSFPGTWQVSSREAYIATHIVLFLAPTELLPAAYRTYLRRAIPAWIALFARAGDLDLVAELVMTAHALGDCVDAAEWQFLFAAQEPDGLMPFRLAWRGQEVPAEARFLANYHSTLVTLAACATCSHDT
jgi:hypothetical protein